MQGLTITSRIGGQPDQRIPERDWLQVVSSALHRPQKAAGLGVEAVRRLHVALMPDPRQHHQPGTGDLACRSRATTSGGERRSASPYSSNVGTWMRGSTSRRSASAKPCSIGHIPAGRTSSIIASASPTTAAGTASLNSPGSQPGTHCWGGSSASRRARSRRSATTLGGNEPAQPAYAEASTSERGTWGWRRYSSNASPPPHDSPPTWGRSSSSAWMSPARQSA